MSDRIEQHIQLEAPVSRVWRALTDYREFNEWFLVNFERPFVTGQVSQGQLTYPGYEHHILEIKIQEMNVEHIFSFTWHPYALDRKRDYSVEIPTLVEFRLKKTEHGTLLSVTESGFDKIPHDRRSEAFRMNERGWAGQMRNIRDYIEQL